MKWAWTVFLAGFFLVLVTVVVWQFQPGSFFRLKILKQTGISVTFVNNDPNLSIEFNTDNQLFKQYLESLRLYEKNGVKVADPTSGLNVYRSISAIKIIYEKNPLPTVRSKIDSSPALSSETTLDKNVLIIKLHYNNKVIEGDVEARQKTLSNLLEYWIGFLLTESSATIGKPLENGINYNGDYLNKNLPIEKRNFVTVRIIAN